MSTKGQLMNLTIKSICALLIASSASASSYWESNISDNDLNWDTVNNQFAYQTWLEEVDGNPSSWQTSKLNYINNNYLFTINETNYSNLGSGTPDFSPIEYTTLSPAYYNSPTWVPKPWNQYTGAHGVSTNEIEAVHEQGWTGKGFTIGFHEWRTHLSLIHISEPTRPY